MKHFSVSYRSRCLSILALASLISIAQLTQQVVAEDDEWSSSVDYSSDDNDAGTYGDNDAEPYDENDTEPYDENDAEPSERNYEINHDDAGSYGKSYDDLGESESLDYQYGDDSRSAVGDWLGGIFGSKFGKGFDKVTDFAQSAIRAVAPSIADATQKLADGANSIVTAAGGGGGGNKTEEQPQQINHATPSVSVPLPSSAAVFAPTPQVVSAGAPGAPYVQIVYQGGAGGPAQLYTAGTGDGLCTKRLSRYRFELRKMKRLLRRVLEENAKLGGRKGNPSHLEEAQRLVEKATEENEADLAASF